MCHGLDCEDRRKVTMHGKDIAYGDGSAVSDVVKGSFHDDFVEGMQNLVRHLAHKYPRPNTERHIQYFGVKGIYAPTKYIFMYIPEDAIDKSVVAVDNVYHGPSNDCYYQSLGVTEDASRLSCRERACGCQPCLKLQPGCTLTPANSALMSGTTPCATTVVLYQLK